jgi:hypothetical protein
MGRNRFLLQVSVRVIGWCRGGVGVKVSVGVRVLFGLE